MSKSLGTSRMRALVLALLSAVVVAGALASSAAAGRFEVAGV